VKVLALSYFPAVVGIAESDWESLPAVAPGDFAAIADQAKAPTALEEIVAALRAESGYRAPVSRSVGFAV